MNKNNVVERNKPVTNEDPFMEIIQREARQLIA
ncbi:hypothetical protein MNBD_GAMMA12-3964 [hydrothermal vent metagenome]|uniref:Uncharacterized protein n=1 Tax=hydrothermal vent metagenome TaxID=652676 RepID=A0A3B0YLT5_9ZZZZ